MRIGASEQVAVFLKNERCIKLSRSSHHELRCRSHSMQQRRARADTGERLSRTAVCTEDVVGRNTSTAETAVDRLYLHCLNTRDRRRHSITHSSRYQLLEVMRECVPQL